MEKYLHTLRTTNRVEGRERQTDRQTEREREEKKRGREGEMGDRARNGGKDLAVSKE